MTAYVLKCVKGSLTHTCGQISSEDGIGSDEDSSNGIRFQKSMKMFSRSSFLWGHGYRSHTCFPEIYLSNLSEEDIGWQVSTLGHKIFRTFLGLL